MKIVIPSFERFTTCTTPLLLHEAGITEYTVVVNSEGHEQKYRMAGRIPSGRIVVSGAPRGIQHQRQWIEDHLIADGEWYLTLDDNIRDWWVVPQPHYSKLRLDTKNGSNSEWRRLYCTPTSIRQIVQEIVPETIREAERVGAHLCGFGTTDNHFYRPDKFKYRCLVANKAAIRQKTQVRWDAKTCTMEEVDQTAQHLLEYGTVVVNGYVFPVSTHYQAGGIGTLTQRLPAKREEMEYMRQKWPGLFVTKEKKTIDSTDLQILVTHEDQLTDWRKRMFTAREPGLFDTMEVT